MAKKIKNKFLVPILLLQLIALAVLGYVGYRFSSKMLREQAERQFRKTITEVYGSVENEFEIRLSKIDRLLRNPIFIKYSAADYYKSDVDTEVFNFQKGNGLVLGEPEVGGHVNFPIGLLANEGGRRVLDMGIFPSEEYVGMDGLVKQHVYLGGSNDLDFETMDKAKLDRSNTKWFQVASKEKIYIGKPEEVKLYMKEYQPIIIESKEVAIPEELIVIALIHMVGDSTKGVLMVTTTPDFIYDFMPKEMKGSLLLVLDDNGGIIAKRGGLSTTDDFSVSSIEPVLKKRDGGIFDYGDNLIMYRTSPLSGWSTVMIGEKKGIFAGVYHLRNNILLIMIASVLIMGLFVYLIIRKLLAPILRLKRASDEIAGGELGITIDRTSNDEIGKLTDSFNHMSVRTKEIHDQLERSNVRLSKLNFIRRQMLHIISHELRTPMSGVIGFYELLKNQIDEGMDSIDYEDLKDNLGLMGEGIDKCEHMVERLTKATSVMAGEIATDEEVYEPARLKEVVLEAVKGLREHAASRNIDIAINLQSDCLVACPSRALNLLLEEALSNAIKYSKDDSSVEVYCNLNKDEANISIRDHGCGIPQAYIDDVVEPFFEVADAKHHFTHRFKEGGGGLGLGFTIILNVLKHYQGSFKIDSKPGKGTVLILILPILEDIKDA